MSPYPALAGLRIGCVKYLNSKPLIFDFSGPVVFEHPAELARGMVAGDLDAALVPVFEAIGSREYRLVDGVAIASRGPVYSVFLAYRERLEEVRSVVLDPASLTSVHLLKVLLEEFHGMRPEYLPEGTPAPEGAARLLIGNQAIEYRRTAPAGTEFLDLGEEWQRQTGLPFVFALWLLRADLPNAERVAQDFRRLKRAGLARRAEIVAREKGCEGGLVSRYLSEHIRFDLGAEEKAAIGRFRDLCERHGFVQAPLPGLVFV